MSITLLDASVPDTIVLKTSSEFVDKIVPYAVVLNTNGDASAIPNVTVPFAFTSCDSGSGSVEAQRRIPLLTAKVERQGASEEPHSSISPSPPLPPPSNMAPPLTPIRASTSYIIPSPVPPSVPLVASSQWSAPIVNAPHSYDLGLPGVDCEYPSMGEKAITFQQDAYLSATNCTLMADNFTIFICYSSTEVSTKSIPLFSYGTHEIYVNTYYGMIMVRKYIYISGSAVPVPNELAMSIGNIKLADGKPHAIAIVYSDTINIVIDGHDATNTTYPTTWRPTQLNNSSRCIIGASGSIGGFFTGNMYEVGVYSLNSTDIAMTQSALMASRWYAETDDDDDDNEEDEDTQKRIRRLIVALAISIGLLIICMGNIVVACVVMKKRQRSRQHSQVAQAGPGDMQPGRPPDSPLNTCSPPTAVSKDPDDGPGECKSA